MTWVKLDDDFYQHPKVIRVGPLGLAMQVAALCYSNHNETRGRLPYEIVPRLLSLDGIGLAPKTGPEHPFAVGHDALAEEIAGWLVDVGMWIDDGDSYLIHDYADYQLPPVVVDDLSSKRREAGRKGAEKRWRKSDGNSHGLPMANANGNQWQVATPVPVPDPESLPAAAARARSREDDEYRRAYRAWDNQSPGGITVVVRDHLDGELEDGTPIEWIELACQSAGENGGRKPWKYVKAILDRYRQQGGTSDAKREPTPIVSGIASVSIPGVRGIDWEQADARRERVASGDD